MEINIQSAKKKIKLTWTTCKDTDDTHKDMDKDDDLIVKD